MPTKPRFVIYADRAGQYRWRLVAANGRIVADSGEAYTRRRDAKRAVDATVHAVAQVVTAQMAGEGA